MRWLTRVLLDAHNGPSGWNISKASGCTEPMPIAATAAGELRQARATREVILCGGAFNTPQLLMLSGIGPRQELSRSGIEARVDLAGSRQESPRPLRSQRGQSHERGLANAGRRQIRQRRFTVSRVADAKKRRLYHQRRRVGGGQAVANRIRFLICFAPVWWATSDGYFPGYSKLIAERQNYLELDRAEGAYDQPRRHGHAAIRRSTPAAEHRLPVFRRRQRSPGQGSRRRRRGNSLCPGDDQGFARTRADRRGRSPRRTISIRR